MGKSFTVLIVDDEHLYRHTLRDYLEERGFKVVEAVSLTEALQKMQQPRRHKPQVAVVDVRLGPAETSSESGIKLAQSLSIPVIFVTAYENDAQAVRRAFESQHPPYRYVFKGEGMERVVAAVQDALRDTKPSALPWYREPSFVIISAITLLLGVGLYVAIKAEHARLLAVIVVGVVVEVVASLLLRYLRIE